MQCHFSSVRNQNLLFLYMYHSSVRLVLFFNSTVLDLAFIGFFSFALPQNIHPVLYFWNSFLQVKEGIFSAITYIADFHFHFEFVELFHSVNVRYLSISCVFLQFIWKTFEITYIQVYFYVSPQVEFYFVLVKA